MISDVFPFVCNRSGTQEARKRNSIGLQNVHDRLRALCNGTLSVASGSDGTTLTIRLPKQAKSDENVPGTAKHFPAGTGRSDAGQPANRFPLGTGRTSSGYHDASDADKNPRNNHHRSSGKGRINGTRAIIKNGFSVMKYGTEQAVLFCSAVGEISDDIFPASSCIPDFPGDILCPWSGAGALIMNGREQPEKGF